MKTLLLSLVLLTSCTQYREAKMIRKLLTEEEKIMREIYKRNPALLEAAMELRRKADDPPTPALPR